MKTFAIAVVIWMSPLAGAQDHEHCPMAAASHDQRAAVDHRHDELTGVGHENSEHHFLLAADGGSIRLELKDPTDAGGRGRIREHLQTISRAFAAGDFTLPLHIHDQQPPGVDVMTARKAAIRYSYADTDNGGLVTIATADAEAKQAIHRFLRFQIGEHGTGDRAE